MKIKLIDDQFSNGQYAGNGLINGLTPKIVWDRDFSDTSSPITFFTDTSFHKVDFYKQSKIKIAWCLESPVITSPQINWLKQNINKFDKVLTFHRDLLEQFPEKCIFFSLGGTWIKENDWKIYDKTRNTSIIASVKNWTVGHNFRHQIVQRFKDKIDFVCGNGYHSLEYKLDGLKDFRYSFIIENCAKDYYFSEKLIDSFLCGTIPIFFGMPSIENYFDIRGMEIINSLDDIDFSKYTEENYMSRKEYIINNFEKAKDYSIVENWIFDNVILRNFWDLI